MAVSLRHTGVGVAGPIPGTCLIAGLFFAGRVVGLGIRTSLVYQFHLSLRFLTDRYRSNGRRAVDGYPIAFFQVSYFGCKCELIK